ncbi:MAG: type II secretion system protein [Candidatus Omnitrophica bacterium]|nr:type II secretion system protein [Candidatus Omnitrophota bacterium]
MTQKRPAFTLIELTLVTVIILAIAGLSIPLFRHTFSDLSSKDAAFNISKLVSYAREKSIINRKTYKVIFDLNGRKYQLFESGPSAKGPVYVKEKSRFGKSFGLPQGLSFYDPKTGMTENAEGEFKKQVVFYPDGHCDELFIGIIDKGGAGYTIALKGFGSFVQIKEVKVER